MKYNIYDVAKKAGVSIVTVSKVINNSQTVREGNRQKVLQAMKELNYNPSAAARSLASGRTGTIGLLIDSLSDTFLSSALSAINGYLEDNGYFLALSLIHYSNNGNSNTPFLFQQDRVDGLLIVSPVCEDMYILDLKGKKIPFVLLDNQKFHPSIPSVIVNNYKGGYDATRHLLELGHKRILHISGPEPYMSSMDREAGYKAAILEAGLEPLIINSSEFSIESGYEIARQLINENKTDDFTAIFAADDYIALGVIDAFKNENIKVPADISVIGYDDQELASAFHPGLTTIRQPAEEMGRLGAEILLKIIRGEVKRYNTVKLDPTLVIRESTAGPKL
jgi:LacI family transcriptional regulator